METKVRAIQRKDTKLYTKVFQHCLDLCKCKIPNTTFLLLVLYNVKIDAKQLIRISTIMLYYIYITI